MSERQFKTALNTMSHRGPDDTGVYGDGSLRLGHQRLSILDLSINGHQPMSALDGQVWIVFNGEVYNHREIRNQLGSDINYQSATDTETILHAYLRYGHDVVKHLNGIFAFAIFDKRSNELFVARDQLGVKPLYYFHLDGNMAFSSELKALVLMPGISRDENLVALVNYLYFLWSPGEDTPFQKVRKLKPGHYFVMDLNDPRRELVPIKYYELPFDGETLVASEHELIDALDEKICTAVQRQLLSDVPVGFFLSGGLDSSLIVAIARRIVGASFNCYSVSLDGTQGFDGCVDDLKYAEKVARHLDLNLIRVPGHTDILRDFDKMIWHLDEPQADPAPLHVLNISRCARDNGDKVLLGGTAGDDLFSGYRRHQALDLEKVFRLFPGGLGVALGRMASMLPSRLASFRRIQKLARGLGKTRLERMAEYYSWMDLSRIRQLFKNELVEKIANYNPSAHLLSALECVPNENEPLNMMLFWDLKFFLADHNLNYTDKMSMAVGVEVRVPFLELELVEFGCKLPVNLKMRGGVTKYILRKVAERYLPRDVIYRPKSGFGAPVRQWINDGVLDSKIATLQERTSVFSAEAIGHLVDDCKRGKLDGYYTVWSALAIDSWMSQFLIGN